MNHDPESFEDLRRLLALKRHEQPPPGYFNQFSREVLVRIRAGERAPDSAVLERLFGEPAWLRRVWSAFESKPVFAGGFGFALCAALVTGVFYSETGESRNTALLPQAEPMPGAVQLAHWFPQTAGVGGEKLVPAVFTNGSLSSLGNQSLFEQFKNANEPRGELINFQVPR